MMTAMMTTKRMMMMMMMVLGTFPTNRDLHQSHPRLVSSRVSETYIYCNQIYPPIQCTLIKTNLCMHIYIYTCVYIYILHSYRNLHLTLSNFSISTYLGTTIFLRESGLCLSIPV